MEAANNFRPIEMNKSPSILDKNIIFNATIQRHIKTTTHQILNYSCIINVIENVIFEPTSADEFIIYWRDKRLQLLCSTLYDIEHVFNIDEEILIKNRLFEEWSNKSFYKSHDFSRLADIPIECSNQEEYLIYFATVAGCKQNETQPPSESAIESNSMDISDEEVDFNDEEVAKLMFRHNEVDSRYKDVHDSIKKLLYPRAFGTYRRHSDSESSTSSKSYLNDLVSDSESSDSESSDSSDVKFISIEYRPNSCQQKINAQCVDDTYQERSTSCPLRYLFKSTNSLTKNKSNVPRKRINMNGLNQQTIKRCKKDSF